MGISKGRISSPLEAGPSLLDSQKLPSQLLNGLDYVSDKLIRKRLHLTLIVVPNDHQLLLNSPRIPSPAPPSTSPSLSSFFSRASSPVLLSSYKSSASSTPSTPSFPPSPSPSCTPDNQVQAANPYNITLVHSSTLSSKATRHLHETVTKASKKFSLGSGWLSTPCQSPTTETAPATGLHPDLIRRSLQQNDVVFSNEGLTLLSLDRVYSFKLALSNYSRTLSTIPSDYEAFNEQKKKENSQLIAAVDSLRLLILSQNGRRISRSYLTRAYDHLAVSATALAAVMHAYKAGYPGEPPISGMEEESKEAPKLTALNTETTGAIVYQKGPLQKAPATPVKYEDVTPITRGEWGFLMEERLPAVGGVETC